MKEDGTSPPLYSWLLIMTGLHDYIIEIIGSPEFFMGGGIGQIHPAIIVPVAYSFAPPPALPDWRNRYFRQGSNNVITAIVNLPQGPNTNRTSTISFSFAKFSPGSPKCAGHNQ